MFCARTADLSRSKRRTAHGSGARFLIMASSEEMRVLLARIGGMERALVEQQAPADQAATTLQDLQQQQQQTATTAHQAQRRAAAAQAAGAGASAVVDTRLLSKPMAFDGRETSWRSFKFQFVAYCGALDSRIKDLLVPGREQGRRCNAQHPHGPRHASSQCAALLHANSSVCQEGSQKLPEHAGDTEGGSCMEATAGRVRAEGRRTAVRFAAGASPLRVPWRPTHSLGRVSRCCFAGIPRCQVRGRQRELEGRAGAGRASRTTL